MSELFDIYQENIKLLFKKVSSSFDSLKQSKNRQGELDSIDKSLHEIEKLIKDLEIHITTGLSDQNFSIYVKNFKTGYEMYRKRYLKEKDKIVIDVYMKKIELKTMSSTVNDNIAYKSFEKLQNAKRATIEMESVGNDTLKEFDSQKDQIKKITNKVSDMNDQLSSSTGLITEMDRREKRNNILVIFAITLLVIFFGILIIRILPKVSSANTISVDLTKDENVTSLSEE